MVVTSWWSWKSKIRKIPVTMRLERALTSVPAINSAGNLLLSWAKMSE
jgi:hypothetical protein